MISTARPGLDGTIIALSDQRVFEAGLESSRRAVEPVRDFLGAYENCAAALERFAEAEAPLRRAVELAADKPEAHRDLGEILAGQCLEDSGKAERGPGLLRAPLSSRS